MNTSPFNLTRRTPFGAVLLLIALGWAGCSDAVLAPEAAELGAESTDPITYAAGDDSLGSQAGAALAAAPGSIKGWVWANQPGAGNYAPSQPYQYNSSGAINRIARLGVGRYRVTFPGLATPGGTVQVSAYGGNHSCQVENWAPAGANQHVNVRCFRPNGTPGDGRFTALFFRHGPLNGPGAAYLWANNPNAPHTPSLAYQWNSSGATNGVGYLGAGRYQARLPGLGGRGGTVLVTAYGADARRCKVANWSSNGGTLLVNVRCTNANGALANARFVLSFRRGDDVNGGFALGTGHHGGYAWSNQAVPAGCFTPSLAYQSNSTAATNTACRLGAGSYRVHLPGLEHSDKATAITTAYGTDNRHCTIGGWSADGADGTYANVRCYTAGGAAADARFTLSYLTDDLTGGIAPGS